MSHAWLLFMLKSTTHGTTASYVARNKKNLGHGFPSSTVVWHQHQNGGNRQSAISSKPPSSYNAPLRPLNSLAPAIPKASRPDAPQPTPHRSTNPWPWPISVAARRPRELFDKTAYYVDPALDEGRPLTRPRPGHTAAQLPCSPSPPIAASSPSPSTHQPTKIPASNQSPHRLRTLLLKHRIGNKGPERPPPHAQLTPRSIPPCAMTS
jgi:hypothetical protein